MIILDTNVVSEPLKPAPNLNVINWLDRQAPETLFLTSTSLCELMGGVEQLPKGKRKTNLREDLLALIQTLFGQRVLPFDYEAALAYAEMSARAKRSGISIALGDGQIAAIALHKKFTVATRDSLPFTAAGVKVINPWLDEHGN